MITEHATRRLSVRPDAAIGREDKVDPMWSADEDERRIAFARKAAAGARKALAANSSAETAARRRA